MRVIGLTGGIGSGKSTVAALLKEKGAQVIDADRVGHQVYRSGSDGWRQLVEAFGPSVVGADGEIHRPKLAQLVFGDAAALERLNAITHPLIVQALRERLEELRRASAPVVVLEAAVLIEAGWTEMVDEVWLTVVSDEVAVERASAAGRLSRREVEERLRSQISNEERRRHAQVVIDNNGSREELQRQVDQLWAPLMRRVEYQEMLSQR